MASPTSISIADKESAFDSLRLFQECGFFCQENAEIGQLVAELDSQGLAWKPEVLGRYLPILLKDQCLRRILERFDTNHPSVCFYLGSDNPNHYFASTIKTDEAQDHRAIIYMWSAESHINLFVASHKLPSKGVRAANGLFQIPYVFLTDAKGLQESETIFKEGGVMIVHPRFSFGSTKGYTMAYAVQEKGYIDKHR